MVEHKADTDCRQQGGNARRVLQTAQTHPLDQHTEQAADHSDDQKGRQQRNMQPGDTDPAHVRPDHVDRAMCEVDQIAHPKDQRQTNRSKGIDVANHQTVDRLVKETG